MLDFSTWDGVSVYVHCFSSLHLKSLSLSCIMSYICKRYIFVFETGLQKLRSKCIFFFRSLLFLSAAEIKIQPRRCLTETNFD